MRTVYSLRQRPIGSLEPGDIRVLLGQQEGVAVLTPRALDLLENEPLVDSSYYPGDLLVAVLGLPQSHWQANPDQHSAIKRVVERVRSGTDPDAPDQTVTDAIEKFG